MKVSMYDKNNLLIECHNPEHLDILQSVLDGSKIRNQPMIKVPLKSGVLLSQFESYGIEASPVVQATITKLSENNKKRIINIAKIKAQYGGDIRFDYNYHGYYEKPMDHQKVMFNAIYYSDAAAIIADPGTCKTAPYLWAIDKRVQEGKIKKTLVITLSDLKKNVIEEMSKQVSNLKGVILENKAKSEKILNKKFVAKKHLCKNIDYDVYVANYESMDSITKLIQPGYFDMVVLDEAHRVGSPGSDQTKSIVDFFDDCPYKYIITGTLHANNIMSFYMPFRFLGADTVPYANYYEFRRRYMFTVDPDQHIWKAISGAKEVVRKITGNLSVGFKKEDCLDLPPLIQEVYSCEMAGDQKELYDQMKDHLVGTIDAMCDKCDKKGNCDMSCEDSMVAKNALILSGKLHQICSGFYINTRVDVNQDTGSATNNSNIITLHDNPKMSLLISTLNNMPDDDQVIIWTNYTASCKHIGDALSKSFGKDSFITCFGDDDAYEKVQLFRSSKKPYIVANPHKMGVGQNIQFSHYQIFFNNSRSFIVRDQALGWQHRQGQKEKVTAIDLVCLDSMDEVALTCLQNKYDLNLSLSEYSRVLKNPKDIRTIISMKKGK